MTQDQKKTIEELRVQFSQHCKRFAEYGSDEICNFEVLMNDSNPEDQNITVAVTTIDGISDSFQPYVKILNLMIEPDGTQFNMSDIFPQSKVVAYVQTLKKIS
ncbi:MAG: hypothetical protein FJY17_00930 [Bacteroidetes bacterium]|nr:hypothetical protein [Bacteroidota bacterium]